MKTYNPTPDMNRKTWYVVDAEGATLGRLASRVATVLRGKHKPTYSPSADMGDFVIVVNADKVHFTGNKATAKQYYYHTGYVGGIRSISLGKLMEKCPEDVIRNAVQGMLPKGPLGRRMFKKLKVYKGEEHPHTAQRPETLKAG